MPTNSSFGMPNKPHAYSLTDKIFPTESADMIASFDSINDDQTPNK